MMPRQHSYRPRCSRRRCRIVTTSTYLYVSALAFAETSSSSTAAFLHTRASTSTCIHHHHRKSSPTTLLSASKSIGPKVLQEIVGLSATETKRLMHSEDCKRLNIATAKNMLDFFREDINMSEEQAKKVILKCPQLLHYSRDNMKRTADFFLVEVGLAEDECVKMILLSPTVLRYSVDKRLRPTIDFFRDEIGTSKWKWIARRYPFIFSHSVDNVLRPRAIFMHDSLGLERRADLSQIASKFPPVFWLPEDNISAKMAFMKKALDLSKRELRDIVVTYPQWLGLSLKSNLQPTVEFLLAEDGAVLSVQQLKYFVSYQPALLAYSLDKRIKPRIRRMRDSSISFSYSPPVIMSYTNEKFDVWLEEQTSSWSISS